MKPRTGPLYRMGATLEFGPEASGLPFLAGGWSVPEQAGYTWSDGPEAVLLLAVAQPARDAACTLELMPFTVPGILPQQEVEFFFNHYRVGYAELAAGRQPVSLYLPRELFMLRTAILTLNIRTARSPHALEMSADRRRLGVALWSFQIAPVA
ncbi:hypothetical protein [Falsiroseomonas sp. CW058]|uniref:hypothetical protein n=1 Tax=Falsiroseomonas sp. CW058 TaxID=3388664 RepID=UPI003D321F13